MIREPAGRCRIDAIEPEIAEFQRIDEHIHRANRIALVDPIIKAFRQQRRLLAIRPLNKALHHPPAIQQGNHSIVGVFTQPGPEGDLSLSRNTPPLVFGPHPEPSLLLISTSWPSPPPRHYAIRSQLMLGLGW